MMRISLNKIKIYKIKRYKEKIKRIIMRKRIDFRHVPICSHLKKIPNNLKKKKILS